ncbi:MAG: hypothetical protein WDN47_02870 [Candidatus Doudnabacteria bacterium]
MVRKTIGYVLVTLPVYVVLMLVFYKSAGGLFLMITGLPLYPEMLGIMMILALILMLWGIILAKIKF